MTASVSSMTAERAMTPAGHTIVVTAPLEGWLAPLAEIPDPVFAGGMLGDGVAIDPTGGMLHAPCAGTVASLAATGHAVTLRLEGGAELLLHLGVDTVAMGGRGFTPLVAQDQVVAAGDPLVRFDLDAVVTGAASAMTPVLLLAGEEWTLESKRDPGPVKVGDVVMALRRVSGTGAAMGEAAGSPDEELVRELPVPLRHGIHARPAARLRQVATSFEAVVRMEIAGKSASLRSPVGVLALGVSLGDRISLHARGRQAGEVLDALEALIASGMGELAHADEQPPAQPVRVAAPAAAQRRVTQIAPDGTLTGVVAAPGVAVGEAVRYRLGEVEVSEGSGDPATERGLLDETLAALRAKIAQESEGAPPHAASILAAHAVMLEDEDLLAAAHEAIAKGDSAGAGWRLAIGTQVDLLLRSGDARLAERVDDMRDLERQVLCALIGGDAAGFALPQDAVLIAEDLLPSQLMALDPERLAAICLVNGGPTSHVAILAAGLGVPMLVAMGSALDDIAEGAVLVVDAAAARLETGASAERIAGVRDQLALQAARRAAALEARGPCHTADGTRIEVFANLGSLADARQAMANGAEGCGLLRSEFLFVERAQAPGAGEQLETYQAIADALEGRPLIVRLLDIGGDKPAPFLPMPAEENPALGLRGIRVGLAYPELLEAQVEAILSVRPAGQCRIMVPMVASLSELRAVRGVVDGVAARLGLAGPVSLGIMVETPAAAATADILAREADFLSVGTNDLTQYALAMDRGNAAVASAIDGLHPAVLRLIALTCEGGARHGRWTGVCGSLASDPLAVPLLLGLGVGELSATPAQVPDIKALVTGLDMERCRALAARALECGSAGEVRALVREFLKEQGA
ncbi:phosphoenolpyruvate--protein phosphotransferase [Novosphingobium sp. ST904]|uniref:phosphoenolpyruvate--protein phosphotransferase n=1 Tax=Novosphingobium sp. ST904 TaxID=1684385 RepID=UPI001E3774A0|nr:phosphoenolpyruvate--protein phosphotransferase [Novosphingobium sp. ST904]